ncbi:MAG: GIY-YIG nuclease family protein [Flavobacteriales bacterium]|nr:MAG: GIY-YIG nuclease family protein [Flavobacteriales bacterium]
MRLRAYDYWAYIMTNPTKTVTYVGMTNNLPRRCAEHRAAADAGGGSFVGRYNVRHLVYFEYFGQVLEAIAREKQLKSLRREKKARFINAANPRWVFLDQMILTGEVDIGLPLKLQ